MNKKARQRKRSAVKQAKQAFTRKKAEKLVSQAIAAEQLDDPRLVEHKNKHVQAKLQKKAARLAAP